MTGNALVGAMVWTPDPGIANAMVVKSG